QNYAHLELGGRLWAFVDLGVLGIPFIVRPLKRTKGFPALHFWCLIEGVYVYIGSMFGTPTPSLVGFFPADVRETGYRILAVFLLALIGTALLVDGLFNRYIPAAEVRLADTSLDRSVVSKAYTLIILGSFLTAAIYAGKLDAALGSVTFAVQ